MFTYNSHQKSACRAFDFLYDPIFKCDRENLKKIQMESSIKMAPVHLIPSYVNMFSDTKLRNYQFHQRNLLPFDNSKCQPKISHNIPLNKTHFYKKHPFMTKDIPENETHANEKSKRNMSCQTQYRESECQTTIWEPQPKLAAHCKTVPEILFVECNEDDFDSEKVVCKIERDRIRRDWEEKLAMISHQGISLKERKEQMKVFGYEDYLIREKEFNENQELRMEYVNDALEIRQRENAQIQYERVERIIENCSTLKNEKLRKLKSRHARKLLAHAKFIGYAKDEKDDEEFSNTWMHSKMNLPYIEIPKVSEKLSNLKQNYNHRSEKNNGISMKELEEYISYLQSKRCAKVVKNSRKCLKENDDNEEMACQNEIDYEEEFKYQNNILVQKTIKGAIVRKTLLDGVKMNYNAIKKYKRLMPIRCVTELLPLINDDDDDDDEEKLNDDADDLQSEKSDKIMIVQSVEGIEKEKLTDEAVFDIAYEVINEICENSCQLGEDEMNRKLLNLANEERERRKKLAEIDAIHQRIQNLKNEAIKMKVDEMYQEIVADILENVIPEAIEMIAEKDAKQFILRKAEEISQNAFNIEEDDLNEVLLPLITAELEKDNEQLIALLGSYDAFDAFIKNNFTL